MAPPDHHSTEAAPARGPAAALRLLMCATLVPGTDAARVAQALADATAALGEGTAARVAHCALPADVARAFAPYALEAGDLAAAAADPAVFPAHLTWPAPSDPVDEEEVCEAVMRVLPDRVRAVGVTGLAAFTLDRPDWQALRGAAGPWHATGGREHLLAHLTD